jgi:hypothetical protein
MTQWMKMTRHQQLLRHMVVSSNPAVGSSRLHSSREQMMWR